MRASSAPAAIAAARNRVQIDMVQIDMVQIDVWANRLSLAFMIAPSSCDADVSATIEWRTVDEAGPVSNESFADMPSPDSLSISAS